MTSAMRSAEPRETIAGSDKAFKNWNKIMDAKEGSRSPVMETWPGYISIAASGTVLREGPQLITIGDPSQLEATLKSDKMVTHS